MTDYDDTPFLDFGGDSDDPDDAEVRGGALGYVEYDSSTTSSDHPGEECWDEQEEAKLISEGQSSDTTAAASLEEGQLLADTDGDGQPDTLIEDIDGDGTADQMSRDTDADGIVDLIVSDTDGDGRADLIVSDSDHDGVTDTVYMDTDGDGMIDTVGYDPDQDGELDEVSSTRFPSTQR